MMSAAILVPAGADQVNVRSASPDTSSDKVEPNGISFAKSFSERVGDASSPEEKSSAADVTIILPSVKAASAEEKSAQVAFEPGDLKKSTIAGQKIFEQGKLKGPAAEGIGRPQAVVAARAQEKISAGVSLPKEVEAPTEDKKTTDEGLSIAPLTPDASAATVGTDNVPVNSIEIPDVERPLVISAGIIAVRNDTSVEVKTKEVEFPARTSKLQASVAAPRNVQKTIGTGATRIESGAKPSVESSTASVIPVTGQTVTTSAAPLSEIDKTTVEMSVAVSEVAKMPTGVSTAAVDGSVRKGSTHGAKPSVTDAQTPVASEDEQGEIEKPGVDPEKMPAVTVTQIRNGEDKMQNTIEPTAAVVHLMFGGAEVSSSIAAVAPGHSVGDLTAIKPVSDVGAHLAGLPIESRDRDGSGTGTVSADGMPRMITATPTTLEVGIPNGTHGWLKVRAEMADGGINASVSAATSAGQEMLHRELPSLTAYLQQEKVAVNTVVIHTAAAGTLESRSSTASMDGRSGSQTPQKNNEGGEQLGNGGRATASRADEVVRYPETGEDGLLPLATYAGGSWLSVRA